jgi:signal transduction histidine kinase
MILNPIVDDAAHVVGLAGMVLDRDWMREEALPAAIGKYAPEFFPGLAAKDIVVTVRDGRGNVLLGEERADGMADAAQKPLPYAFTEWTVGVHARRATPEEWARAGFYFNVALAVLLVGVMAAGAVFALRGANRAVLLSELKSDFVSNVSHELRTPVASIRVFAEFLKGGRVTDLAKIREYGEYIETESRRLSRLIDNILDFARIESGRKTYRFAPARLEEVVASTVRTLEVRLREAGLAVEFTPSPEPIPALSLDEDAIGQALHNLIDNAVKYSGDSRWVGLSVRREGREAVVAVADRGIGIAREEHRRIFERFHRVGSSLVHDVKGSGLGLSIVQHVVEAHGGRITVESEPGRGTVFALRLPIPEAAAPDPGPEHG